MPAELLVVTSTPTQTLNEILHLARTDAGKLVGGIHSRFQDQFT